MQPIEPGQSGIDVIRAVNEGLDGGVDIANKLRLVSGQSLPNIDAVAPGAALRSQNAARTRTNAMGAPLFGF